MEKGLYIHIPFCIKKCIYCDFYSITDREFMEQYINAIEIELLSKKEKFEGITTVYIGGGTPTILTEKLLGRLFQIVMMNIDTTQIKEMTIESNPGTLNEDKVKISKEHGVTRISLGIQSMNEDELILLKRSHKVKDNIKAMDMVKKSGLDLSIDLIYGIPGQKLNNWKNSLRDISTFKPEHISTYELTITEGTELHRMVSNKKISKPDEDTIIEMYYYGMEYLKGIGLHHYEISNFAIPGHECLHNINYWRCGEYTGIGAGAHSFYNSNCYIRTENIPDVNGYIDSLMKGKGPPEKVIYLNKKDRTIEYLMLGMRMLDGIKISNIDESYRYRIMKNASPLIEEGLLSTERDTLRVSKRGILLLNEILLRLIDSID